MEAGYHFPHAGRPGTGHAQGCWHDYGQKGLRDLMPGNSKAGSKFLEGVVTEPSAGDAASSQKDA